MAKSVIAVVIKMPPKMPKEFVKALVASAKEEPSTSGVPVDKSTTSLVKMSRAVSVQSTMVSKKTSKIPQTPCAAGESVFAPAAGTVTKTTAAGNWGGVVEITAADGMVWRVCGVSGITVKPGDKLNTGNQIGTAGTVDAESLLGDHIHLEIEKDGTYHNPADYLN